MPYKHPKISYGLPTDVYNEELVKEYIEDLTMAVELKRKPVGVKFIFTKEEYDSYEDREIKGKLSYCAMIEKATRGDSCKSLPAHHLCDGGTTALALEQSTPRIESGEEYFSYNLYATKAAARRMRNQIVSLSSFQCATYGLLIRPLEDFTVTPDVVLIITNPAQSMRLMQGYVYHTGIKPTLNYGAMQAICSEATATPYLTGELNISLLCPSTRMLCRWQDEEMVVGITFELFTKTVEGVIATINSTDLKKNKEKIKERFKEKGKDLELIMADYGDI